MEVDGSDDGSSSSLTELSSSDAEGKKSGPSDVSLFFVIVGFSDDCFFRKKRSLKSVSLEGFEEEEWDAAVELGVEDEVVHLRELLLANSRNEGLKRKSQWRKPSRRRPRQQRAALFSM